MYDPKYKDDLEQIFRAAVAAVHPLHLIPSVLCLQENRIQLGEQFFPFDHFENIYVTGAGKATAAMAAAVENILTHRLSEGVISVKAGHALPLSKIRTIEAGHPLPDANSVIASYEIKIMLQRAMKDDLVIFLLSGGASSLMADLPQGCNLRDINSLNQLLLNSGASIDEMNTVRKHLSQLKGGQVVKVVHKTKIVSFIISDVPGNDLSVIGSGPTVADKSTYEDAWNVLEKYMLMDRVPQSVQRHLKKGINGTIPETPKENDALFKDTHNYIIADNKMALMTAKVEAERSGYDTIIITESLSGLAEDASKLWIDTVKKYRGSKKMCLIAGGETTVKVNGTGKGGRNQQFALAAAIELKDENGISLLAGGTDGTDGPTDAAGAVVDGFTYQKAKDAGIIAEKYLMNNDSYRFFEMTGGHVRTGPTQTNVMDIVITLIGE